MLPKPFTAKRSFLKELKDVFWNRHVGGCISSFWSLGRKKGGMVLWRICRGMEWSNEDYETLLLLQPYILEYRHASFQPSNHPALLNLSQSFYCSNNAFEEIFEL